MRKTKSEACHHHIPRHGKLHGETEELTVLGNQADPFRTIWAGERGVTLSPKRVISPCSIRRMPKIAWASSVRPDPTNPADSHNLAFVHNQIDVPWGRLLPKVP